jgi:serine/threonine protein kinase
MAPTPRPTVATPSLNKSSGASLAIDSSDDESDPWRAQPPPPLEKEEGELQEEPQQASEAPPGAPPSSSALLQAVRRRSIASIAGSCASPSVRGDYDYAHSQEIGRGAYGVVVTARHRPTGETRALKVIDKGALEPKQWEALEAEVAILASLEHPNIVRLYEHFDDGAGHHVLAMEYLKGGELLDRLLAKQARGGMEHAAYTEASCRAVIAQVLGAVSHCHARGIVHRDLKVLLLARD